jgi:hypothetical protein
MPQRTGSDPTINARPHPSSSSGSSVPSHPQGHFPAHAQHPALLRTAQEIDGMAYYKGHSAPSSPRNGRGGASDPAQTGYPQPEELALPGGTTRQMEDPQDELPSPDFDAPQFQRLPGPTRPKLDSNTFLKPSADSPGCCVDTHVEILIFFILKYSVWGQKYKMQNTKIQNIRNTGIQSRIQKYKIQRLKMQNTTSTEIQKQNSFASVF